MRLKRMHVSSVTRLPDAPVTQMLESSVSQASRGPSSGCSEGSVDWTRCCQSPRLTMETHANPARCGP